MASATATLAKWGNSNGLVIPVDFCRRMNIKAGDKVSLSLDGEKLTIEPERVFTLEALMAGYDGPKPGEYDWGKPAGKELW